MSRLPSILGALLLLLVLSVSSARAMGDLTVSASSPDGTHMTVTWYFYEYYPNDCPALAGYDVYRRSLNDCPNWTRVNAQIVPLQTGSFQTYQISDTPPLLGTMYEYEVRFVDAARNSVSGTCVGLCGLCSLRARGSAPDLSAPITQGRLQDWGWAVAITPCATGCYSYFFVSEPKASELRPYVATGETIRFWGREGCGGLEGCGLEVDHYEVAGCDVTPARPASWGQIKTLYR